MMTPFYVFLCAVCTFILISIQTIVNIYSEGSFFRILFSNCHRSQNQLYHHNIRHLQQVPVRKPLKVKQSGLLQHTVDEENQKYRDLAIINTDNRRFTNKQYPSKKSDREDSMTLLVSTITTSSDGSRNDNDRSSRNHKNQLRYHNRYTFQKVYSDQHHLNAQNITHSSNNRRQVKKKSSSSSSPSSSSSTTAQYPSSSFRRKYQDYRFRQVNKSTLAYSIAKNRSTRCIIRKPGKTSTHDQLYVNDLNPHMKDQIFSKVLICEAPPISNSNSNSNSYPNPDSILSTSISTSIPKHFVYGHMKEHNFPLKCPNVYDYQGNAHVAPFLCVSSLQNKYCVFTLQSVIISVCGGLLDKATRIPYSFYHPSIAMKEPYIHPNLRKQYQAYFTDNAVTIYSLPELNNIKEYDVVIPARMIWDQHFGHMSHQSIPFIAHVYELLPTEIWNAAYWHCSVFTAALLQLLGIPSERLLIQSLFQKRDSQLPILAKKAILPYVPGWLPPQTPSIYNVANRITRIITTNLFAKFNHPFPDITIEKRNVLYLARSRGQTRYVSNQDEVLSLLDQYVNKSLYNIVIINETKEYKVIEDLHRVWFHHAIHFAKAIVIIGSHGSAFGNMITAPNDVNYIEFNVFPDDAVYTISDVEQHVRPMLISSAFMKGGLGKYYIIDPSNKSKETFYEEEIRVAPYELYHTLKLIGKDILLPNKELDPMYQPEKHIYSPSKPKRNKNTSLKKISRYDLENQIPRHRNKLREDFLKAISREKATEFY